MDNARDVSEWNGGLSNIFGADPTFEFGEIVFLLVGLGEYGGEDGVGLLLVGLEEALEVLVADHAVVTLNLSEPLLDAADQLELASEDAGDGLAVDGAEQVLVAAQGAPEVHW
jgi:hypothetical protein